MLTTTQSKPGRATRLYRCIHHMFFSLPPLIQSYKLNCVHHEQRSDDQNDLQREGLASSGVELLPCDIVTSINASYPHVLNTPKNQNPCRGSVLVKLEISFHYLTRI